MKQITIYDLIPLLKDGYVAFDNGNWWWFSAKPKARKTYKTWMVTKGFYMRLNTFEMKDIAPFEGDWRDSLIKIKHKGVKMSSAEIIEIESPFTVYETPWGSYYVNSQNKPMRCFFKDGQELIVENFNVVIHDNGIEFLDE